METQTQTRIVTETLPAVYVAGEHLPGHDESALVPVQPLSADEILAAFAAWMRLDVADGNPSPETIRVYLGDLRAHLAWLADQGLQPAQAGEEDLKSYRAHLVERYAISTVGRKLASIRRFYQMAQARDLIAGNPAEGLRAPRQKTERHERVKYLTQVALQRLLAAPDLNTPKGSRDRAIMVLMIIHGLRVVEVHRADLEDLDLEAGESGELRVLGKGDKGRTVLLTDETREEIRRWLAARNLMATDSPALFVTMHWSTAHAQPGGRISRRGLRAMVDTYLERTGAKKPGISCHALRHSFATHSLANGAELLAISGALGHASITTTQVYAKIVDKARSNPAKFLTGLLDIGD